MQPPIMNSSGGSSKELSALKAHFFTLMSHEFRTSLNTILMSVELLEGDDYPSSEEERAHYRQQIKVAAEHMRNLLNEALENFSPDRDEE
ncbi:MAG: histidine kinase dimerization/phospho-acceptor domain-containing protein [Cyanobacteriota bacterium]|nr:histidine kinase dimerization/phospho-acceptor domain-containing protein [Cyanobacteriota bacterium]